MMKIFKNLTTNIEFMISNEEHIKILSKNPEFEEVIKQEKKVVNKEEVIKEAPKKKGRDK